MKSSFYAGLFLCLTVMANLALWIALSTKDLPFNQTKAMYLGYFPDFLRNATLLTVLSIAASGVSIYLLSQSRNRLSTAYQRAGQLLISVNMLLISWQVFSLM